MELGRVNQNKDALYRAACFINVINGRPELVNELINSPKDVVHFISNFFKTLINDPKWLDAIKAIARHERARKVVLNTIDKITTMG